MITLRRKKGNRLQQQLHQHRHRNSMLVTGTKQDTKILQLSLSNDCFKGRDVRNLDSKDSLAIYSFLCSLLAFALREFSEGGEKYGTLPSSTPPSPNIVVLIECVGKQTRLLRLLLRACQSALAYQIRQCIVLERETSTHFQLGHQIMGLDLLLDSYDFKTVVCSRSKLASKYGICQDDYFSEDASPNNFHVQWQNIQQKYVEHTNSNKPSFIGAPITPVASLAKFLRKDNSIVIELAEQELDDVYLGKSSSSSKSQVAGAPTDCQASPAKPVTLEQPLAMEEVGNWVNNVGKPLLNTLNAQLVDGGGATGAWMEVQLEGLSEHIQVLMEKTVPLLEWANNLQSDAMDHQQLEAILHLACSIQELLESFSSKVQEQELKLANWKRFQQAILQFYTHSDDLIHWLCTENYHEEEYQPAKEHKEILQALIDTLKSKMDAVEEKIEAVLEAGTALCTLLRQHNQVNSDNNSPDKSMAYLKSREQQELSCVVDELSLVTERRKRCWQLVELRTVKLKQMKEIVKCEQYTRKIVEKMTESLGWLQSSTGSTTRRMWNHDKAQKRLYEFARQLTHIALVLRQLYGLKLTDSLGLKEKLEVVWEELNGTTQAVVITKCRF